MSADIQKTDYRNIKASQYKISEYLHEKISARNYTDEFPKVISDENFSFEPDERIPYCCYILE